MRVQGALAHLSTLGSLATGKSQASLPIAGYVAEDIPGCSAASAPAS